MSEHVDHLKSLHTALIDSRNGYDEALRDGGEGSLKGLFGEMVELRNRDAAELARHLQRLGEKPEQNGSFMSTVHRTIMSVRSLFGGLDGSVLPGLIDGEKRILGYYDEALISVPATAAEHAALANQRENLQRKIAEIDRQRRLAA